MFLCGVVTSLSKEGWGFCCQFFPGGITNGTVQESDPFLLDRWINAHVTGLWTVGESSLHPGYQLCILILCISSFFIVYTSRKRYQQCNCCFDDHTLPQKVSCFQDIFVSFAGGTFEAWSDLWAEEEGAEHLPQRLLRELYPSLMLETLPLIKRKKKNKTEKDLE